VVLVLSLPCSRVDEAADVYSLGCILYECVARQQPFGHLADEGKSFNVLFKVRGDYPCGKGFLQDSCVIIHARAACLWGVEPLCATTVRCLTASVVCALP
jgi:hypothetical protein